MDYKITLEVKVEDCENLEDAIAEAQSLMGEGNSSFVESYAYNIIKAEVID